MTADEPRRFPLGIAMHNAMYDASVPTEPPAGDEPREPHEVDLDIIMPAELLAVLVNIETKPRTCEYLIGVPGFGLGTCARPATHYVTSEPCGHGGYACDPHLEAHVAAIGGADPSDRVLCVRCKPAADVSHITYSKLETSR